MAEVPIGALIRTYRQERKLTAVYVATHAGISARYLEMIEAGTRTPSIGMLHTIARILGVRTSALLGGAAGDGESLHPSHEALPEIERALLAYPSLGFDASGEPPALGDLSRRVQEAWDTWTTSAEDKYGATLPLVPGLIVDVEWATRAYDGAQRREAYRSACEVYQLARAATKRLGRVDLARVVADRAMRAAEETADPVLLAAATWNLSQATISDDMAEAAEEVAIKGAERLEPLLADGEPAHLAMWGALYQAAAVASARRGNPWQARTWLRDFLPSLKGGEEVKSIEDDREAGAAALRPLHLRDHV